MTTTLPLSQTWPRRIKRPQELIPSSSMSAKGNTCNQFGEIFRIRRDKIIHENLGSQKSLDCGQKNLKYK